MHSNSSHKIETLAVHAGTPERSDFGAAVTPMYASSVFAYGGREGEVLRYPRYSNLPDQQALADALSALEGAEASVFMASGMAATSSALLATLAPSGHLLLQEGGYGGTYALVSDALKNLGITFDLIDGDRPQSWAEKLRPNTKAIFVESITNPLVRVPDLKAAVAFARAHKLVSIIDHTFTSPVLFRPIPFGFDLSIQSVSKYLNGHSDLLAGSVSGSREWIDKITSQVRQHGGCIDPHVVFLIRRGLKTLPLRVHYQSATALALSRFLESRPEVRRVHYPGLESSPYAARASELFASSGGVLAFEPRGGVPAAEHILQKLTIPLVGPSLGGVESLTCRPVLTSHAHVAPEVRNRLGILPEVIRVAVGVEHPDDLIADFAAALDSLKK